MASYREKTQDQAATWNLEDQTDINKIVSCSCEENANRGSSQQKQMKDLKAFR